MISMMERLTDMQRDMMRLADEDAKVFAPLADAYRLPAGTEEEKARKAEVMEEKLLAASLVPLEVMELAVEGLGILKELGIKGSVMAVSDVGVAVQFARTAVTGAVMNVYINTKSMKVRKKAEELNAYADSMVARGTKKADRIYQEVLRALR